MFVNNITEDFPGACAQLPLQNPMKNFIEFFLNTYLKLTLSLHNSHLTSIPFQVSQNTIYFYTQSFLNIDLQKYTFKDYFH